MIERLARLGLGRLVYQAYYRPLGALRQSLREGGPLAQARDRTAHAEMRAAADCLPPLPEPCRLSEAAISFLSGPKYWHQTVFCFVSLQLRLPFRVTPVIHDDGAMDQSTIDRIRRVVPWARFVGAAETEAMLDAYLPEARYPALRERRRHYPHLRKLTDIHAASREFRLVADSDMLFFHQPTELVHWFTQPGWIYMTDVATAYGYPLDYLSALAGAPVPPCVNVGLYALDGSAIDWDRVEHWCARQLHDHGSSYLQEQALTAMLFAGREATALARERYVVMPDDAEGARCSAVMHHYVDLSKRPYFRHSWRLIAELAHKI